MNPAPLHARNPGPMTGDGNWTWLVDGALPTLVDAGAGDPDHIDAIAARLEGRALAQVLVTHGHSDHASGAAALAARWPGLRFLKMPWTARDGRWHVPWTPLGDGDRVPAGDDALRAVHTPGHAPDHLCFWHAESRTLFGGDLVIGGGSVYVPPAPHGDLAAYLASLERVRALDPARILPAHGPVVDSPDALLRRYVAHRLARERQILDALRDGGADADAVVARVYGSLTDEMRRRARETVVAHLEKLQRDRRADRRGEAWHIIDP